MIPLLSHFGKISENNMGHIAKVNIFYFSYIFNDFFKHILSFLPAIANL